MSWHEILQIILRNFAQILKITFVSTILVFILLLVVVPITFISEVTILPPEKSSQLSGLGSLLGSSEINSFMSGSVSSANSQLYGEILKSRSASLYVVEKLQLMDYLDARNKFEAAEILKKKINLNINKEGIIELSVEVSSSFLPLFLSNQDKLKNLSAQLSNCFAEALDRINREKNSSKARNARIYIESQLVITNAKLDSAETRLLEFQQNNKTISLPDQVEAVLKNAADIKSEITKTEIQIELLDANLSADNKIYKSLVKKLEALQQQYSKLEIGSKDYMIAFNDMPALGKELTNILREVKIQNEVYTLLQQQYYKEKIQENRDLPTVQILDLAIPPTKKASPKVILSSIVGMMITFIISSLYFVIIERKRYV